jgi:FAD/FMN-containing dehydrogenase
MTTQCSGGLTWTNYPATQRVDPYRICKPRDLASITTIVREAQAVNRHVHAFGSAWSFSDCATTPDYLIDTKLLNRPIQTVQRALRPGQSRLLYHAEAGMTIESLYTELAALGQALETMGGSSGQTLAGAISTGTHGGDLFKPPLADSVLALHLVGVGGAEYWIEPSSGITDSGLLQEFVVPTIDARNIIYDDAIFNACLVSLGCMGVIYAVVLKVREAYDLIETTIQTTWPEFVQSAPVLLSNQRNRFLQVALSPYPDKNNSTICLVTTRSEAPATKPGTRPKGNTTGAVLDMITSMDLATEILLLVQVIFEDGGLSDDQKLVRIVETVLSQAPDQRPVMTEHYGSIMAAYLPPGEFRGLSYSVMDTSYGQQATQGSDPGYSVEVFLQAIDENGAMPFVAFVNDVVAAIETATDTMYTGYFALRFTGATRATLGMQQWEQNCSVELSSYQGVQGEYELYPRIMDIAARHGALLHWGQLNEPFTGTGSMYPGYDSWRAAYATMSRNFTSRTFENALSVRWNLTNPP